MKKYTITFVNKNNQSEVTISEISEQTFNYISEKFIRQEGFLHAYLNTRTCINTKEFSHFTATEQL